MTNYYGVETTDDVEYDKQGLPIGTYKAMIVSEEPDAKGRGVVAEFEALEGPNKGRKGKVWYLTLHENTTTSNIAKQNLKRIAEATGRAVTAEAPLKGRVLTLVVGVQKNDDSRTDIKKYLPEGHVAADNDLPPI